MAVKVVDITEADKKSAQLFFTQLLGYYETKDWEVLDMFARTGDLTVCNYAANVGAVDCWELEAQHFDALAERGVRDIKIGCAYKLAEECDKKYDMVVVDSPQGIHSDYKGCDRVEHFSAMLDAASLLKDEGVLVLYVNKAPYDKAEEGEHGYDTYAAYNFNLWMSKREFFYTVPNGRCVSEDQALHSYREHLALRGFYVDQVVLTPCYSDVEGKPPYAYRLGLKVKRLG